VLADREIDSETGGGGVIFNVGAETGLGSDTRIQRRIE
jgi:hypothetical protein